jgi:hypothetical protein
MNFLITLICAILITNVSAQTRHDYTYSELQSIVGYQDIWQAHKKGVINEDEYWSLSNYINYDDPIYPEINTYLRTGKTEEMYYFQNERELLENIQFMDSGMLKLKKLPSSLMTYRGQDFDFRSTGCYRQDEEYIDKAYVSTSTNISTAQLFSGMNSRDIKNPALLYLYSNSHHPGILINAYEEEVLLPRSLTYKVMQRKDRKNVCHLLIQICTQPCLGQAPESILNYFESLN